MSVFEKPIFVVYIPKDIPESIDKLQKYLDSKLPGYEVLIMWGENKGLKFGCEVLNGSLWDSIYCKFVNWFSKEK